MEVRTYINGTGTPNIFSDREIFINNGFRLSIENSFKTLTRSPNGNGPVIIVLNCDFNIAKDARICRKIRNQCDCSLMVISNRSSPEYESALLESGADIVLTKPIIDKVLLAHLKALIRRQTMPNGDNNTVTEEPVMINEITIDEIRRTACIKNIDIHFTSVEFDLFLYLARNANRVISRDELYQRLMRMDYNGLDRRIDIQVSRLRKKLLTSGIESGMIKTVRNEGYILINNRE